MNSILAWRLCEERWLPRAFSGDGPFRDGGRWNPLRVRVVYCSESRSLAAVEVLANSRKIVFVAGARWFLTSITVPMECVEFPSKFPENWSRYPHPPATQEFGAAWVRASRSAVLRVPSAVILGEFNYLLNPAHRDFRRLKAGKPEPFIFDPRLGISPD